MPENAIDRLEDKIDRLTDTVSKMSGDIRVLTEKGERIAHLEGRVTELEKFKTWLLGASAAIAIVFGAGSHYVAKLIDTPALHEAPVEVTRTR